MAGDERRYGLYNTNSREERSTPVDTASVKTEVEGGRTPKTMAFSYYSCIQGGTE